MDAHASVNFDRIADQYDESRGGVARGERMATDIAPWLVRGQVLEVGVGTGIVAAALRAHQVPVIGVDLSAAMLHRAYSRLGSVVIRADARSLPVASGSVDNVLFVNALHVIGGVSGAVAEAARVLRPGGRLLAVHGLPRREPSDDVARTLDPLTRLQKLRSDVAAALDGAAASSRLHPIATSWVAPASLADVPNAVADRIERRLWSYLWTVEQPAGDSVVAPVIDALRALPEPDRPRRYQVSSRLDVFELPGGRR
jgi:SAM-dependent methyltransferase